MKQIRKTSFKYNKSLLRELVITDFKLRYQGSVLGYLWSLLRPLGLFVVLYIVFVQFLRFGSDVDNFAMYLLLGIIIWGFFTEMTNNGLLSIVNRGDLIRKLEFPKLIIVLSGSIAALINLFFNLIVFAIFMIATDVDVRSTILIAPILLVELYILGIGLSLFLSSLYVRYRDISHIWEIILQALFYVTPILYPLSIVPSGAVPWLMLNPMAQIIQDLRYTVVTPDSTTVYDVLHGWHQLIPFMGVAAIFVIGVVYFRKRSPYFAEEV